MRSALLLGSFYRFSRIDGSTRHFGSSRDRFCQVHFCALHQEFGRNQSNNCSNSFSSRNFSRQPEWMYSTATPSPAQFPDIEFGVQPNATDTQIDEAYRIILPWFVHQYSHKGGLEMLSHLMDRLGNPHHRLRVVHVGGTNGKGSTSEKIMEGLRSLGSKDNHQQLDSNQSTDIQPTTATDFSFQPPHVGLFTSPHIASIRERFRIDGNPVTKSDFVKLFYRLSVAAKDEFESSFHLLSFFEMLTAMMFMYFYEGPNIDPFLALLPATSTSPSSVMQGAPSPNQQQSHNSSRIRNRLPYCDYAVIEVGLGGRLDSTNIIPASSVLCAVITSIGWDHMSILGSTLEEIAGEKAGILKSNCPVVLGPQATCFQSINDRIAALHCYPVVRVPETRGNNKTVETFDSENQRIAREVLEIVSKSKWDPTHPNSIAALEKRPKFRCQKLTDGELVHSAELIAMRLNLPPSNLTAPSAVYLDVGHNRTALRRAINEIRTLHRNHPIRILCSLSIGRNIECLEDVVNLFINTDGTLDKNLVGLHYCGLNHFRVRSRQSVLNELSSNQSPSIAYLHLRSLIFESLEVTLSSRSQPNPEVEEKDESKENQEAPLFSDSLVAVFRQSAEEQSILVVCGTVFVMQEVSSVLGLPLCEADPLESNERRLPDHWKR